MSVRVTAEASDPLIGHVLGERYRVESLLGEGAMGMVYRASHVRLSRAFAIKVLHSRFTADAKMALRFEREAELTARLRHPNVIGSIDVGETADGRRFTAMDLAVGPTLAELMDGEPMERERIISLVRQLLDGLHHAHEAGLVHRDFKPENVIVETNDFGDEVPRIVDFGIAILRDANPSDDNAARLTTAGLVLGTPHYMAPEQACSDPIDHRVDLFALGVTMYEMLCGVPPFEGTGVAIAHANVTLDPPKMSERAPGVAVDPLLEAFARRLMARKREDRPATARAARELLDLIANDRRKAVLALKLAPRDQSGIVEPLIGTEETAPSHIPNLAAKPTPRRWRGALVGALAISIAAFAIAIVWQLLGTRNESVPVVVVDSSMRSLDADQPADTASSKESEPVRPPLHLPAPHVEHDTPPDADVGSATGSATTTTPPELPPPAHPKPIPRPPITPSNFYDRYTAMQRALKEHGTNAMWEQFQRIDPNTALAFPEKQREAIEILAKLERQLD